MRQINQSPSPQPQPQPHHTHLLIPLAGAATTAFSLLLFLLVCFRKITRKRTAPEADSKPPHRFSYSLLRRATDSFAPTRRLGQGGFGSVFFGTLPHTGQEVAVKLMDSGSLQGEREFQNELFFASMLDSPYVISVLGFSADRKRRRMLLVYEFMSNGNLQDALLHRKCPELMEWKKRFSIMVDIAKGLRYLHGLDPPVVHGDVKPSNVLLDSSFNVKIADFGLARLKSEIQVVIQEDVKKSNGVVVEVKKEELESNGVEDYGSVVEETESVTTTGFEDSNFGVDQSPESLVIKLPVSPETPVTASPVSPEENVDKGREEGGKQSVNKDWWMRQENGNGVKDYVMEWIGNEIGNERPTASSSSEMVGKLEKKKNKKRNRKRLEWWMSMEEDKKAKILSKAKRRPAREWWKEEYCDELTKKKKKKEKKQTKGMSFDENESDWWPHDDELYAESRKKKKSRSKSWGSMSSIDWWLDGIRRNGNGSNNSASGEIPKSCGMSSTPSMRGTVCYVAPEYGFGGDPSELCDVYSFGVLLLVVIAGRRPLQVTNSPLSEFQRANLLSWARRLARAGKLIELVDKSIQGLEQKQALLCITVALVCLQKIPARRPSMKEVVGMLTGELEPPKLPPELTTSSQSRFSNKSHKKVYVPKGKVVEQPDTEVVMQATNLVVEQAHVPVVEQVNVPIVEQAVASTVDRFVALTEATPLVARCSENRFALLADTSSNEIMHIHHIASEPVLEDPCEHLLTDQEEVDESFNDAQFGMQIGRSNDVDDVVQDTLNSSSCLRHNVQPKFCWGDLENEKPIGHSPYVRSESNSVSSWYDQGDAFLEDASLQTLPKIHHKKIEGQGISH